MKMHEPRRPARLLGYLPIGERAAAPVLPPSADVDAQQSRPTAITDLLNGAAPTVPFGGFDGRFGVWR
jgi:hypothetical protein